MATRADENVYADSGEWESLPKERQYKLVKVGDVFIGKLLSRSRTEGNGIPQAHFLNDEGQFFINCGWDLERQLRDVPVNSIVRIEKTGVQATGQTTPMDLVDVQFKRP